MGAEILLSIIVGYIVAFLIAVFITRAIFSIPKFLRIKKAELKLLSEIAIKQGVNQDLVHVIVNEAN